MSTRSPRTRGVHLAAAIAVPALVVTLALAAQAGQPASLSDESGSAKPVAAVKDTARAKRKTAPKTTVATAKTAPAKPAATKAAPAPSVAKGPTPAAGKSAPTVARASTTPAKSAAVKPAPTVAQTSGRLAPKSAPTVARTAPTIAKGAGTKPNPHAGAIARIPSVAAPKGQAGPPRVTTASLKPNVRSGPVQSVSGPALAKQGGTTVRAAGGAAVAPPTKGGAIRIAAGAAAGVTATKGGSPTSSPSVSKGGALTTIAPLEDHITYQYNALGRRDPFQSLIDGDFVGVDVGGQAPPDLGGLKVVGIVWGTSDQFAMVEDARGNSHVLRRGDQIMNGYVEGLKRDAMIVNITVDGQSQSVSIPLTRKGEKSNANR